MKNDIITGTNLGNWLVLEKWMSPAVFAGTDAEDEIWLNRLLSHEELERRYESHRRTYITREDFENIKKMGLDYVRIPVPFFIFGDYENYIGCIEYLDMAFKWANASGIKILIDLHTVPGSQNGFDNGGLSGVCKFGQNRADVEFVLTVLECLAARYANDKALWGIEVLNEPASKVILEVNKDRYKPRDEEEAKGSSYLTMEFLQDFYMKAYERMRAKMPEDKVIVLHDGFRFNEWRAFFKNTNMKNVCLDTHVYLAGADDYLPAKNLLTYRVYMWTVRRKLAKMQRIVPVIVGEWCMSNAFSNDYKGDRRPRYQRVWKLQRKAWSVTSGWFYWNYQLEKDSDVAMDAHWKDSWDLKRCVKNDWINL